MTQFKLEQTMGGYIPETEINGWQASLAGMLGCLMMLPILMDLYHPLAVPFGWLYLVPVCLYSIASSSHSRIWTLLAACSVMLVVQTLIYIGLNERANTAAVLTGQTAAGALLVIACLLTHFRLWTRENAQLKRSLRSLQGELDRAREVLDIAEDACGLSTYQLHPDSGQLLLSDTTLEMLGVAAAGEIELDDFSNLLLPGYREEFDAALSACARSGTAFTLECQLLTRRNERLWLQVNGAPELTDDQDNTVIGTLRDLSDEKAQQQHYAQEFAKVHESLNDLPGVHWQYSQGNGLSVTCTDREEHMDHPDYQFLQQAPLKVVHPDDRFRLLRQWYRTTRRNAAYFQCQARFLCRDQQYRCFQLQASRNSHEPNLLLRGDWIGVGLAVANQDSQYGTLQRGSSDELQKLAHRLNNILTAILGAAETIEMVAGDRKQILEETTMIIDAVSKASLLVEDESAAEPQTTNGEILATLAAPGEASGQENAVEPTDSNFAARKSVILLVEDDELVRRHAQRILRNADYHVLIACDGREAIAVLKEHSQIIDIMITDMFMPGTILGSELVELVQHQHPHIRTILASGYDTAVVNFFNNPAANSTDILAKPFKTRTLLERVATVLNGKQPQVAPKSSSQPAIQHRISTAI